MLLARADADAEAVREVTAVLLAQRQEIAQQVTVPFAGGANTAVRCGLRIGPRLDSGAASYYDKDKPSFLHSNAD